MTFAPASRQPSDFEPSPPSRLSVVARKVVWKAVAVSAILSLLATVALAVRCFKNAHAFVHFAKVPIPHEMRERARSELRSLQDVQFRTSDGLLLKGWLAPGPRRATVVFIHGVGGNRLAQLPEMRVISEAGYGVLGYDSRASGESEGKLTSWGDKERRDLVAALDFLSSREDVDRTRIAVAGFSAGSSTALLTGVRDQRVRALILCATWPSLAEEVDYKARHHYGLAPVGLARFALEREGVAIDEIRPIDAIASFSPRPLLMLVGAHDNDTPSPVVERLFAAARAPKQLWIVPGGHHGGYALTAPGGYREHVVGFLDRTLGEQRAPTPR